MVGMSTPSARAAATPKMSTGRDPGALKALRSNTCAACAKAQEPSQKTITCLNQMSGRMSCQPASHSMKERSAVGGHCNLDDRLIVSEQCESSMGGTASMQPDAAAIAAICKAVQAWLHTPRGSCLDSYIRQMWICVAAFALWCSTCQPIQQTMKVSTPSWRCQVSGTDCMGDSIGICTLCTRTNI